MVCVSPKEYVHYQAWTFSIVCYKNTFPTSREGNPSSSGSFAGRNLKTLLQKRNGHRTRGTTKPMVLFWILLKKKIGRLYPFSDLRVLNEFIKK